MACHLKLEERRVLDQLMRKGLSIREIASLLERHWSTIYREIRRNSQGGNYRPEEAQRMAKDRRRATGCQPKMSSPQVYRYVREGLDQWWSPEQIAGRMRLDMPRLRDHWLSRQTIYNWINDLPPEYLSVLRRGGRLPEKRGKLSDCVRIDGRPNIINRRRRYGDWEGDTMVGKDRRSALLTLVERKSGYARIGRVDGMTSALTMTVATRRLKELPPRMRRSITFDNGKEFAEHRRLTRKLGLDIYFAKPYASWQRGTNENTNGLLRQFFPKGTDFTQISHRQVACAERLLNERPRKRLGYRTPAECVASRICRD